MLLVIADTGPMNYLLLIGHSETLPKLFKKVILPSVVRDELANPNAPLPVRDWIANPPSWLDVRETAGTFDDTSLKGLDAGEGRQSFLPSSCTPICY